MSHFSIRCRNCGKELKEVYCAFCEHCKDSLLVTFYKEPFKDDLGAGIWRFNWLPVHGHRFEQPGPVVYKSEGVGGYLGLENLFVAFNGYWPERGADLMTCTFKEFEAAVVLQNASENGVTGLVVASAGNTARAFAHLSTTSDFPVIIVVPRMCLSEMWYIRESLSIPTLAVMDGDYADSIDVARRIATTLGMPFEGGVKNIAKRDGLGIVLLEAVSVIGRLPDHYFQAIGSGTGAIGVWEMAERFMSDGRFGKRLPKLHLSQNYPFIPMVRAWQKGSRTLDPLDLRPELIGEITTRVLSTRYPAYSVKGGIYDALKATDGLMYALINEEVYKAMELFEKLEGIDIVPASGVAFASLIRAVKGGNVKKDETILLNITGGGEKRVLQDG
ncbi:MAG: cysteate synthase, partial [Thermodesulfovibrionales bacterium]